MQYKPYVLTRCESKRLVPERIESWKGASKYSAVYQRIQLCCVHMQGLSEEVLYAENVQRVVSMQQHLESGNWAAFLQLATSATYLQGCLAHMYFQGVRARALNVIVAAGEHAASALSVLHSDALALLSTKIWECSLCILILSRLHEVCHELGQLVTNNFVNLAIFCPSVLHRCVRDHHCCAGLPVRGSDPPAVCIPAGDLQHTLYLNSPEGCDGAE